MVYLAEQNIEMIDFLINGCTTLGSNVLKIAEFLRNDMFSGDFL